jgi:bifunctional DNA-binding transcriptional regulator/antitoxin component of YhaV-PrlF toxin-antitoxin module
METTLSTKGQVVLPRAARQKLALPAGTKFACRVSNGSIVLTPKDRLRAKPRLVRDPATGLTITESPAGFLPVTTEQVRAALADFP